MIGLKAVNTPILTWILDQVFFKYVLDQVLNQSQYTTYITLILDQVLFL